MLEKMDKTNSVIKGTQNIPMLSSTMASLDFLRTSKMSKVTDRNKVNKPVDLISSKITLRSPKQKVKVVE